MAVTQVIDITKDFTNGSGICNIDLAGNDWAVLQIITNSATINFLTSNDGGAVTGGAEGNAKSAANFFAVQGTNLATGVAATTLAAGAGANFRFPVIGRYLQLNGSGTVVKILVHLSKIG